MADTTSIASRMEKLAKLKRMKRGLSGDSADVEAPEAAAPAIAMPAPDPIAASAPDDFEASFDAAADDSAMPTPDLGSADLPDAESEFDFAGGASDSLSASDFAEEAAIETAEPNLEIPADLLDEPEETKSADEDVAAEPALSAADLGIDEDAMDALDDLVALAGMGELADENPATPDFTMAEIDPELLDREFEHETAEANADDVPMSSEESGGRVAVTFDESRTTLLNHVSRQMNCSVEDVVVTALDWYLDALFGEDEEAKAG